jgi:cell division protein FtsQ
MKLRLPCCRAPEKNRLGVTHAPGVARRVRPGRGLHAALLAASFAAGSLAGLRFGDIALARALPGAVGVRALALIGSAHTEPKRIAEASGLAAGVPLAQVDAGALAARLEQLPWVASARVARLAPNRVVVGIQERIPVAVAVLADGTRLLVDAEGTAFAPAPPGTEGPELRGLARVPAPPAPDPALAGGVQLLAAWAALGLPELRGLEIAGDAPAELPAALLREPELRVLIGAGESAAKLERLEEILAGARAELARVAEIDLRFGDQGVLRLHAPCPEATSWGEIAAHGESRAAASSGEESASCHARRT